MSKVKIAEEIEMLKKEKNALIVGHYYLDGEVQEMCDYVGDSFALSKMCKQSDADTIVFAGVHFMGESAKLLCPDKMVLMPDANAGCKMADMAKGEQVRALKEKYPEAAVVCYINTAAETKAECDVCVTSSNAVNIVRKIENRQIIFLPDKNLGSYVQEQVPEKEIILWDGCCPVHDVVLAGEVIRLLSAYPSALVLAHPECPESVRKTADYIGSTKGIIEFVAAEAVAGSATEAADAPVYVIATEQGILHELKKADPRATYLFPKTGLVCEDMKMVTLEKIRDCMKYETGKVELPDEISGKANACLNKMLEMG